MPTARQPAVVAAELRRLQRRLPELSVPALLRVRDLLEPLLAAERIGVRDARAVLAAVEDD